MAFKLVYIHIVFSYAIVQDKIDALSLELAASTDQLSPAAQSRSAAPVTVTKRSTVMV